jgi:DNA gyrase inhibitor GyrI
VDFYSLYTYYGLPGKLSEAYEYVFNQWLPISRYEVECERYSLEFNMNNPVEDLKGKSKVDLYVPIKIE